MSLAKARPSSLGLVKGPSWAKWWIQNITTNFKNYSNQNWTTKKLLQIGSWTSKYPRQRSLTTQNQDSIFLGCNDSFVNMGRCEQELRCFPSSCNWQRHSYRIRNGHVFQPGATGKGAVSNLRHSTSNGDAFQRSSILQRQSYQSQEWQWCLTICKSNWPGPCPQSKWRLQAWWLFPKKCNLERPTPEW